MWQFPLRNFLPQLRSVTRAMLVISGVARVLCRLMRHLQRHLAPAHHTAHRGMRIPDKHHLYDACLTWAHLLEVP